MCEKQCEALGPWIQSVCAPYSEEDMDLLGQIKKKYDCYDYFIDRLS